MKLTPLSEMDLTYVGPSLDFVDYGTGGQYNAAMEGTWRSDRVSGRLRLTNTAQKRADNVNTPTLRGVMQTDDSNDVRRDERALTDPRGRPRLRQLADAAGGASGLRVGPTLYCCDGRGAPRSSAANEFGAHCRVFACQTTTTHILIGGDQSMRVTAYALPVQAGKEGELRSLARELESRSAEYDEFRRQNGITREAAFQQRAPQGNQLIIYREFDDSSVTRPRSESAFELWLKERMLAVHGFDLTTAAPPQVELLVRQRPTRRGRLYATTVPLLPQKTARIHEFASELNGIHAAEFEDSLRRLRSGLTLFVQHAPDLAISVVEGDEPASALGKLSLSHHPFDRWHIQQIADQTGIDFSAPQPRPNDELWSWDSAAMRAPTP